MKSKVLLMILIFIFFTFIFINAKCVAIDFDPNTWEPNSTTEVTGADRLLDFGNIIIGILRTVGTIISVAVLAILGIKYMLGSVEEKATYKETMRPYLIGAVLVFGITNILAIIIDVGTSLIK